MIVSQRTLKNMAGGLWLAAGAWLCTFGGLMLSWARRDEGAAVWALGLAVLGGLAVGWVKGRYALGQTAARNIARIEKLKEPRLWQFLGLRTVIVIGLMIGLGKGLRALAEAGHIGGYTVVGGVYIGIGVALLRSAFLYWKTWPEPPSREDVAPSRGPIGVLLVNLGTPDSPEVSDVRRYLKEFLSDPFVIEFPRVFWWFILNGIILPFRGPFSAKLYRRLWTDEGSPILVYGRRLADRLQERLGEEYRVALGMRYGNPSMSHALKELSAAGCTTIRLYDLFPQYSRTTTGSVQAEAFRLATERRFQPALQVVPTDPVDPGYIRALAARAREATQGKAIDHWVMSFHGIPEEYETKGDPYGDQCALTAHALAAELGLAREDWTLVFQSRFGPDPWLRPYADETVPPLAERFERVAVCLPGFAADCLETLDEIGNELAEEFEEAGGEELVVVPALNDHPLWVEAIADQIRRDAPRDAGGHARFSVV